MTPEAKQKCFYSVYEPNYVVCGDWEEMFAWKPVKTINGGCVWLATVYKRSVISHQGMIYGDDYATLLDILGEQQC